MKSFLKYQDNLDVDILLGGLTPVRQPLDARILFKGGYGIVRSFRRGAEVRALNKRVPDPVIGAIHQWRDIERARGTHPRFSMLSTLFRCFACAGDHPFSSPGCCDTGRESSLSERALVLSKTALGNEDYMKGKLDRTKPGL